MLTAPSAAKPKRKPSPTPSDSAPASTRPRTGPSPSPQSRSPRSHISLDPDSYPHLFDIILANAAGDTLVALGNTCSSLRPRVDALPAEHLVFKPMVPQHRAVFSVLPYVLERDYPKNSRMLFGSPLGSIDYWRPLFSRTRTLDLHMDVASLLSEDDAVAFVNLQTIRVRKLSSRVGRELLFDKLAPFPARTLVIPEADKYTRRGRYFDIPDIVPPPTVHKVVFCLTYDPCEMAYALFSFGSKKPNSMQQVVYVAQRVQPRCHHPYMESHKIAHLHLEMLKLDMEAIFVGILQHLPLRTPEPQPRDAAAWQVITQLVSVTRYNVPLARLPVFLDADDYAEQIGAEQYALESGVGLLRRERAYYWRGGQLKQSEWATRRQCA